MTLKSCLKSMRLRTLPLSLSGITLGVCLAAADHIVKPLTVVFLALTTICLQILSNLSNELGDTLHGTDTEDRQGIHYSIQDGEMTIPEMKKLIAAFVGLSCLFGALMIWSAFDTLLDWTPIAFLCLGAGAIWAAMHYTLGDNPYGYRGLGDVFVFLFFGLATVCGGYYLCALEIPSWIVVLPACSIGCFSVGVLNVNNIRDMKTDAATRTTVAIKMGGRKARIYQTVLIVLGWAFMIAYCTMRIFSIWHYLFVLTLPFFIKHLIGVWKKEERELDPMLPLLVMSSFAFSALAGFGFLVYLL